MRFVGDQLPKIMTRRHVILIICVGLPWAIALTWLAYFVLSPSPEQKIAIEHDKLRRLLGDLDSIERALSARVNELDAAGQGIDVGNIYQNIDLSNIEGIRAARQRVNTFGGTMEGFGATLENYWARIAEKVRSTDLDEPLATQLKEKMSLDQSYVYPKYRDWILAAREDVEAVTHYLDVNEHYSGQFKWGDNSLSFSTPRVAADLSKAQAALVTADEHYKYASRAALQNHGNTIKFVLSAMRELEEGMTQREGTNKQSVSEKKTP